jgi:hypothetical protein
MLLDGLIKEHNVDGHVCVSIYISDHVKHGERIKAA